MIPLHQMAPSKLSIIFLLFSLIFGSLSTPISSSPADFVQHNFLNVPNSVFASSVKSAIGAIRDVTTPISSSPGDLVQHNFLNVPNSVFASSVKSAIGAIRDVTSHVSQLPNAVDDFRLSTAISDCLELFDLSTDALSRSLFASENPQGKHNGTGDLSSDMRTWLSAALTSQDTCIEGFDGTNGFVKKMISGSINQVKSFVIQLLSMVRPVPLHAALKGGGNTTAQLPSGRKHQASQFPSWISAKDRKIVKAPSIGVVPHVTVALDGSGNYTNLTAAILGAPDYSLLRYVIYVKRGVYSEYVEIKKKKCNIMMFGDGMDVTVISGNRSHLDGWPTYRSATFAVTGRGFIAKDMTFVNTAGPEKHQAAAIRSDSDMAVFYRCSFKGYQDTLYTHSSRQFFKECRISGTVDFICGDATVVFQNCQILARKGLATQKNTITAHGRENASEPTGFSFQFCNISADTDLQSSMNSTNSTFTYLGRPWKLHSRTVVMQSYISNVISPEGWLEWSGDFALDSLFYGEYMNYGPGAGLGGRVKWPGYHVINDTSQAKHYTVAQFIDGDLWMPFTGVGYTSGLAF